MGFRRPAASKIAVFSMKASKAAPAMVYTTSGGLQNTEQAKALSKSRWHAHWCLDVVPLMVTWMLSQLYCSPGLALQCMGSSYIGRSPLTLAQ